eukprot:2568969-Amphidinium_carterae.1
MLHLYDLGNQSIADSLLACKASLRITLKLVWLERYRIQFQIPMFDANGFQQIADSAWQLG